MLALLGLGWSGCTSGKRSPLEVEAAPVEADAVAPETKPPPKTKKPSGPHPHFQLVLEQAWQLNAPGNERFDASGLLVLPNGDLLTLNDRGASLFRIEFLPGVNSANLVPVTNCFTALQLAGFAPQKHGRYDCEGIGRDEQGRLYICEEDNRWILRFDPATQKVERLEIDWKPVRKYFNSRNANASFEGVAVGGNHLYVANERDKGRIVVVDLATQRVIDDFTVGTKRWLTSDVHYSDLCWFDGALYALLREKQVVLKVNPESHAILAEYDFREIEESREFAYHTRSGTGVMEGLAVTKDAIWLATDNNGLSRKRHPQDARPTLFKCVRPDGAGKSN